MSTNLIKVEIESFVGSDLNKMADELIKVVQKSLKKEAKPHVEVIRNTMPVPRWNSTIKTISKVNFNKKRRHIWLTLGLEGKLNDKDDSDFMKAHHMNYGTLERRDPEHPFKNPVKQGKNNRNTLGQPHLNIYEDATKGAAARIIYGVEKAIQNFTKTWNSEHQ